MIRLNCAILLASDWHGAMNNPQPELLNHGSFLLLHVGLIAVVRQFVLKGIQMDSDTFWRSMKRNGGCLEWTRTKQPAGYGRLRYRGKREGAHRVAWTLCFGEIPDGLCVLHRCDNPSCFNPMHLFLGTHAENMRDKVNKGRDRHPSGHGHTSSLLSPDQVRIIRSEPGTPSIELAKRFSVGITTIWSCRNRKSYCEV